MKNKSKSKLVLGITLSLIMGVTAFVSAASFDGGDLSTAGGTWANAWGLNTTAAGESATTWGQGTSASVKGATAWGYHTVAEGNFATAWGYTAKASGSNATAWGYETVASGSNATAWGYKSYAYGVNSTAFGNGSVANASNSLAALGGTTSAGAVNSAAIGNQASATLADSIALGSYSVANTAAGVTGYLQDWDEAYTGIAWTSTYAAIAVGDASTNITRQITGLAAGTADTDAVNVAQLKAVVTSLDDYLKISDLSTYITGGTNTNVIVNDGTDTVPGGSSSDTVGSLNVNLDDDIELNSVTAETVNVGDITINKDDSGTINSLANTVWDNENYVTGQAATEDQLKTVDDKVDVLDGRVDVLDTRVDGIDSSINVINNRISDMDGKINKVGAGAAALASLHPLEYDPDDRLNFEVGAGSYHGQSAAAVGAFYRPNGNIMVNLSASMGNGENMYGLGVSFALDGKNTGSRNISKKQLQTKLVNTQAELADTKNKLANTDAKVQKLEAMIEALIENQK